MKSKFSGVRTFKGAVVNRWRSPDSAGIAAVGLVAGRIQGFGQAHCQAVGKLLVGILPTHVNQPLDPRLVSSRLWARYIPLPQDMHPQEHRGRWPQIGSRRGPAVVLTMVPSSSHDDCERLACVFHL